VFLFAATAVRRRSRTRLHALLMLELLVKSFVMLSGYRDFEHVAKTGWSSLGTEVLFRIAAQVHLVLELVTFYAIGLGWCVMRPHLRLVEWAFIGFVSLMSIILGLLEIACDTIAICTDSTFALTQFTLHSLCFLVIIAKTNFNVFTLQRQISEALAAPETGNLYCKHRAYCRFRIIFLFFIAIPSLTNFLILFRVVEWQEFWLFVLAKEACNWCVHTATVVVFKPGPKSLGVLDLAVVDDSDDSEGEMGEMDHMTPEDGAVVVPSEA